jgi:hypothetical protein
VSPHGLFQAGRIRGAFAAAWNHLLREDETPQLNTEIGRLLAHSPQPLIDPRNKLLVIFSAKSACSNVLVWFLHHLGHAAVARDFHRSPHEYRTQVYYHSMLYRQACKDDFRRYRVVRVIRDPYERAVSGFRHLLRHAHKPFGRQMKMGHVAEQGLSFSGYLDFLERLDLRNCDDHFAVQRHPIEDAVVVNDVINISTDDLFARLNAIEAELGLERTDLRSSAWVSHNDRRNRQEQASPTGSAYTTPLSRKNARHGPWPLDADLLTPQACGRLANLYAVDLDTYGIKRR